jgi:4'-phosphopantetheinyl transferase
VIVVHRVELVDAPADTLSPSERERAARYRVEPARRSFVAARVALRRVLGERLGLAPADVPLADGDLGRPGVAGGRVSFNVSHSGAIGLIAVADGERRVGVDVEQVRPDTDFPVLAERFFHPAEAAAIGDRRDAFFRCWTRKEAVVKALGLGLTHPLDGFVVDVDATEPHAVEGVAGLTVTGLPIDPGYAAGLAADAPLEYAWAT